MELIKKHIDTIVVLAGIVSSVMWMTGSISSLKLEISALKLEMNEKFAAVDIRFAKLENEMDKRFSAIESDIRNINTVLICRGMMPKELAQDTNGH